MGNLLSSDKKFCIRLYQWHRDNFTMFSKIADVKQAVKDNIYDFIADSDKVIIAVDCENSDPYKLCATLAGLDTNYTRKIDKIILFDDIHTATAWTILEDYTDIPVEHVMTERLLDHKSLVDLRLTTRVTKEHYRNDVNAFIIVSSDSDYWELISALNEAEFLMMIEHNKCSPELRARLTEHGIFYCFIDNFLSANTDGIRTKAIFNAIYKELRSLNLNMKDVFASALRSTRASMTPAEQEQFYNKHIRKMTFSIDAEGNVEFNLKI